MATEWLRLVSGFVAMVFQYIQKTNTGETSHKAGREYTHVRLATKVLVKDLQQKF